MAASTVSRSALAALIAALLSSTALAALPDRAGSALAVVPGVTPPEVRALEQATINGQRFVADEGRVLELALTDGTSLTLAPGTAITIEGYSYDPVARTGELRIDLEQGLLRVGASRPGLGNPIVIETPAGSVEVVRGGALVTVAEDGATGASLLYGGPVRLVAGGETEELVVPGFETAAAPGGEPSSARRRAAGAIGPMLVALNPGLAAAPSEGRADDAGPAALTLTELPEAEDEIEPAEEDASQIEASIKDDLTDTTQDPTAFGGLGSANGALGAAAGFGAGTILAGRDFDDREQPSQSASPQRGIAQNRDPNRRSEITFVQDVSSIEVPISFLLEFTTVDGEGNLVGVREAFPFEVEANEFDGTTGAGQRIKFAPIDSGMGNPLKLADVAIVDGLVKFPPNLSLGTAQQTAFDAERPSGLTSNRIFNSNEFTQRLAVGQEFPVENAPIKVEDITREDPFDSSSPIIARSSDLSYYFVQLGPLVIAKVGDEISVPWSGDNPIAFAGSFGGPIVVPLTSVGTTENAVRFPTTGTVQEATVEESGLSEPPGPPSPLGVTRFRLFSDGFRMVNASELPEATEEERRTKSAILTNFGAETLVIREDDNFLIVEGSAAGVNANETPDLRLFFAAGDVDGKDLSDDAQVDNFFVSPGLEGFEQKDGAGSPTLVKVTRTIVDGDGNERTEDLPIRAFLPEQSLFRVVNKDGEVTQQGLNLTDTGVLIVGAPAESTAAEASTGRQSALLHADFGLEGERGDQRSTIAVTIGDVTYDAVLPTADGKRQVGEEVVVTGRTVGSSRDNTERKDDKSLASSLLTSPLFNTAAGGGNDALGGEGSRVGYLVLENFDPDNPDSTGGAERPLDLDSDAVDTRYAVLRLATGVGSTRARDLPRTAGRNLLEGYAAGISEFQDTGEGEIGVAQIDSGVQQGDVAIVTDSARNRVEAVLVLTGRDGKTRRLRLGGVPDAGAAGQQTKGASAYIDDQRFAARTVAERNADGVDAALLSGPLVHRDDNALSDLAADSEHFKWGFFFGDLGVNGRSEREHVHLGTWVAGNAPDASRLPAHGEATYRGQAVGNVFSQEAGSVYTATGKFENRWNFGSRAGRFALDFDDRTGDDAYRGFTFLKNGTVQFDGQLEAPGRAGGVVGNFVHRETLPRGEAPGGVIGRFELGQTGGPTYRASGTFGGEKVR